jgi:hypothetical protein
LENSHEDSDSGRFCSGLLGGLCPLLPAALVETLVPRTGAATISSLAFVLFAVAAGMLLLDQVFGYSSSWMRYRLAELRLGKIIRKFDIDVEAQHAKSTGEPLPQERADVIVERLVNFSTEVDDVVIGETETWIAEFKAGLLQIEQITKRGSSKTGDAPK